MSMRMGYECECESENGIECEPNTRTAPCRGCQVHSFVSDLRLKVMEENKGVLGKQANSESVLEKEFTLFELKRALNGAKNTSPGKDGICYKMIKEIDDVAKYGILKLYN